MPYYARRRRLCSRRGSVSESYLKAYIVSLVAFAVALVACWIYSFGLEMDLRFVLGAAILSGFVLLGDALSVRINERFTVGAWDIGILVAIFVLGPTWAALAALPSAFFVGKKDWLRTAYEVGHSVVIVYLAGIVFSLGSEPLLASRPEALAVLLYTTTLTGATLLMANEAINSVLMRIKYNQPFRHTWRDSWQPYLVSDAVNVFTAGMGALTFVVYGPAAAVVVVAGSVGSQVLVYRSREQVKEIRELQARVESLEEALTTSNTTFGTMIVRELGRRDGYTHHHAAATAVYAADVAREMRLGDVRAEGLRTAALLHNIGLFGLPEELLTATGKLNSIAQNALAEHPARGEEALAAVPELKEMAGWVRWHHERPDGRGYPDKLRGSWIPVEARVLAAAQAYAEAVLDRPHCSGTSFAEARERLIRGVDLEFDGAVVRALLRILDTETEGYRMADDYRFRFPAPGAGERRATPGPDLDLGAAGVKAAGGAGHPRRSPTA